MWETYFTSPFSFGCGILKIKQNFKCIGTDYNILPATLCIEIVWMFQFFFHWHSFQTRNKKRFMHFKITFFPLFQWKNLLFFLFLLSFLKFSFSTNCFSKFNLNDSRLKRKIFQQVARWLKVHYFFRERGRNPVIINIHQLISDK